MSTPRHLSVDEIADLLTSDQSLDDLPPPSSHHPTTVPAPKEDDVSASDQIKALIDQPADRVTSTATNPSTIVVSDENDEDEEFDRRLRTEPDEMESNTTGTPTGDAAPETTPVDTAGTRQDTPAWKSALHTGRTRWDGLPLLPKILIAAGSIIAVLIATTLIFSGGSNQKETPTPFIITPQPGAPDASAGSQDNKPKDGDQPIKPASVTSRCPAGSTDPMQAFGDDPNLAWTCVRVYGIDGQVLTAKLDHPYVITRMSIIPGFNRSNSDGSDEWVKHRTVSVVKYTFDGKNPIEQPTHDVRDEVITPLPTPTLASTIQITILRTTAPTGANPRDTTGFNVGPTNNNDNRNDTDFAVSKISIYGHPAS